MSFYFLRHGETDHNKYVITNDPSDISINSIGFSQALKIREKVQSLEIETIFVSPLKRALETKEIVFEGKEIKSVIFEEFRECSHDVWKNLSQFPEGGYPSLSSEAKAFLEKTVLGLKKLTPGIIIAHGGTFWSICYHLNIPKKRFISNCQLVHFFQSKDCTWDYCLI